MTVARARGKAERRVGSNSLMTPGFQFGKMKKILEVDGGDGCITPLNGILKNG